MKPFALLTVFVLTILVGLLHGRMMNRWGPPEEFLAVGDKLEQIPAQFGDWELVARDELEKASRQMLEPYGYFGGTYRNRATGAAVGMFVIIGPPGTIAVHTPEVCYGARDYRKIGASEPFELPSSRPTGQRDTFWRAIYKRTDVDGNLVPTYWAWTLGDRWQASPDPRYAFAGNPYLYKVQLSCQLPPLTTAPETDPCQAFLADFVQAAAPHLQEPVSR